MVRAPCDVLHSGSRDLSDARAGGRPVWLGKLVRNRISSPFP